MPATYEPIASTTLGSNAASLTLSDIPGTFTDLVLIVTGHVTSSDYVTVRVNGDTGNNYSRTFISGSGSTVVSLRDSNISFYYASIGTSSTALGTSRIQFMSYANTNVHKTMLVNGGSAGAYVQNHVALWRSTAAITSITVLGGAGNLGSGFTASLFGVKAA